MLIVNRWNGWDLCIGSPKPPKIQKNLSVIVLNSGYILIAPPWKIFLLTPLVAETFLQDNALTGRNEQHVEVENNLQGAVAQNVGRNARVAGANSQLGGKWKITENVVNLNHFKYGLNNSKSKLYCTYLIFALENFFQLFAILDMISN